MNHTPTLWTSGSIRGLLNSTDIDAIEAFVRAVNVHDSLLSQLVQHHEDAVDSDHFERLAAGDLGCTTCALIAKAEAL